MNIYDLVVTAPRQMLTSLIGQVDKAASWGAVHGKTIEELLQARLAPDMFPLATQVKFAGLQARETVWRLRGDEIETWECGDALGDLKVMVERTLAFLDTVSERDFEGAEERAIELKVPGDLVFDVTGAQFVRDWAIPQFHFHAVTAYAILRKEGVDLGKADYVPHMFAYLRQVG